MKRIHFLTLGGALALVLLLLWSGLIRAQQIPQIDVVASTLAPAAELYVCPIGCDYSSVQDAVDAASDGDVIKVAAGTYTDIHTRAGETQVVYISSSLTIQGGYTPGNWEMPDPVTNLTTLDAQRQGRVFYISGDIAPIIEGLRITGGDATGADGGGLYLGSAGEDNANAPTIRNNIIVSNTAAWGGGLALEGSDATLEGNIIAANSASDWGGGMHLFLSRATLDGNTIISNTADWGGGLHLQGSDATLINNIVVHNQASGSGSALYSLGGAPRLVHTTIARNGGGDGSSIYATEWMAGGSNVELVNTILVSHSVGISVTSGSTVTADATLWGAGAWANGIDWGGAGTMITGSVNLWDDPLFQDPDAGDYHVGSASPVRDAGVDAGVYHDIDRQMRPMNWGYDLGADESGVGLSVIKEASSAFVNAGQTFTYTVVVENVGEENGTGVVLTDTLDGWQRATNVASSLWNCSITDGGWGGSVVCSPPGAGTVFFDTMARITLTAQVSDAVPIGREMTNYVVVMANETSNASALATYAQDCHARINDDSIEYTTVQAAVDAAGSGDVVKVSGVCVGAGEREGLRQQVYLDKDLTIRGGYTAAFAEPSDPEANSTTLDALRQGRVLYISSGVSPTVEGLRITGGDAAGLGGLAWADAGGGMYAAGSQVTLKNNVVFSNTASAGGGLWVDSGTTTLSGNTFSLNIAEYCGGLQLSGVATLNENTVRDNTSSLWSGGGMCLNDSDATLNRNIVAGNTAGAGGGGLLLFGGDVTLTNNVIAENQADTAGSALHVFDAAVLMQHNTIARNTGSDGSGLYVQEGSKVELVNTILVSHSVGISVTGGSTLTVNSVLWHNTPITVSHSPAAVVTAQNELVGDPAFDNDGYHLTNASPAVDAGVDTGVSGDIDLDYRPIGDGYDLGADEVPPPPGTAEPAGATLVFSDTSGLSTTLDIPAGAVSETTTIVYTPKNPADVEAAPSGLAFGGRAFDLDAYQGDQRLSGFEATVTLTVRYSDADVADLLEDTLAPYRWTGDMWEEIGTQPPETYTLDVEHNVLTLYLNQFSRFGSMGVAIQRRLYLPLVVKGN